MRGVVALAALSVTLGACSGSTEPGDPTAPARVVVSPDSVSTYPGWDFQLPAATVYNSAGKVIPDQVTWSASDPADVQIFTNGYARAGSSVESMTLTATAGKASARAVLAIVREPVRFILTAPNSPAVYGHDSLQMTAIAYGPAADSLHGRSYSWASADPSLATVSATGLVKAVGVGVARILVTCEGIVDTVAVTADNRIVAKVVVTPSALNLLRGQTSDALTAHVYDASNNELIGRSVTFASSDTMLATVAFGSVVAKNPGIDTVIAVSDTAHARVIVSITTIAFTTITTGGAHGCGLTASHHVWCWGGDGNGQLGSRPYVFAGDPAPESVLTAQTFYSLSAGSDWTCALTSDGTPWCWGGQDMVGDGSLMPRQINGVHLVSIALGGDHACGVDAAGVAWCWGSDLEDVMFPPPTGCGTDCFWTPVAVRGGLTWKSIAAGDGWHLCGIDSGNTTRCWGIGVSGQLGDSTNVDSSLVPVTVYGTPAYTQVDVGYATSCAITTAQDAYCWGSDSYSALGAGFALPTCTPLQTNPCSMIPLPVAGGHKFTKIGVEQDEGCGLTAAGEIWCWGDLRALGVQAVPTKVSGGVTFVSMSVNGYSCGFATDGKVYCWQGSTGSGSVVEMPGQ